MLKRKWFVKREWFNRGIRETLKHVIIVTVAFLLVISPLSLVRLFSGNFDSKNTASATGGFQIKTGIYVGDGTDDRSITGLGFTPDFVFIKDEGTAGSDGILFRTSVMTAEQTAKFESEVDLTSNAIQALESDGFQIGTYLDVNNLNTVYYYTAFGGSDCSDTGVFCVGTYTGNGTSQSITSVGFQPDIVMIKRSGASPGVFKTSSMNSDTTGSLTTGTDFIGSAYISSLDSLGFTVGNNATVNTNLNTYWYIAFKKSPGKIESGTYIGDAVDGREITASDNAGLTFEPNLVFIKETSTAVPYFNITENYGDRSTPATDAASSADVIQKLLPAGGFQVGSGTAPSANQSGFNYHYLVFGGATANPPGTGTFQFASGSYTGNVTARSITGIGFKPDLVFIKSSAAVGGVFKTSHMKGEATGYVATTTANIVTGAITSLDSDGFSLGVSTVVNNTGVDYEWQAFGNAYDLEKRSGGSDFVIGTYVGTGITNAYINSLPFQPAFVFTKRSAAVAAFKTSVHTEQVTSYLSATNDTATEVIKELNSNGFTLGTGGSANVVGSIYYYFAFKDNANMSIGTYTGNGSDDRDFTTVGFQPDLVWIKRTTNIAASQRSSNLIGDISQYFTAGANVNNRIQSLLSNGFQLGTGNEVNQNTGIYYYIAWKTPVVNPGSLDVSIIDSNEDEVISPFLAMDDVDFINMSQLSNGVLGTVDQKIRIQNTTANPAWSVSIAATSGSTALWNSGTHQYDFNDNAQSATDGADSDSVGGQMSLNPTVGTITPQSGCTTTGVSLGSLASFVEGSQDSITLISASGSAETNCYWGVTGITVEQSIPGSQNQGVYTLPMTLTIVAN